MRLIQPPPLATAHTEGNPKIKQNPSFFTRPWGDWFAKVVTPGLEKSFRFNSGTHNDRLGSQVAIWPAGSLFWETDRGIFYLAAGSPEAWKYGFGTMFGLAAAKPADLGTNDAGFQFYATDTPLFWMWTGAAWVNP